ncbi:uncharacterized protein LOC125895877 isoform X2 [Epinephelus fuscoguttatus]|uniref:uncharacterized protein LOC125895877 isoform X2 n=1 Tax=Epinephelus fuscoguttatus TaxID=293821 RepID=UPI0020D0DBF6|nr:uncharacterized protein LOC125895877 isoform X2 [Epinephelus fuscoguttatus]
MAEPWRTPHPYQQDPEDQPVFQYQQQVPGMMGPPRPPPPPYPVGSRQVSSCNPNEDVQMGGRRSSNPYPMTPAQVYAAVLCSPPPAHTFHSLLSPPTVPSHDDNSLEISHPAIDTSTRGGQAPVDPIPENPTPQYPPFQNVKRDMEDQGPTTSRAGTEKVQTPTSPQVPCQSGGFPWQHCVRDDTSSATDDDAESLSYSPTTPEPPPVPAKQPRNARGRPIGPAPVQPLQTYTRQRLQNEYGIVPEFIEANLWLLPEGKAKTKQDRKIENTLRSQLHSVAQGPYRMLVRSLLLPLCEKVRKICRDIYAVRKGENHALSRQHHQRATSELLQLRTQLKEMTEFRDTLLTEISVLRGQLATQQFLSHKN